jgi:hypothetical protein
VIINVKEKSGKVKRQKKKKIWLKGEERCNTYLTHVCRISQSIESLGRVDKKIGDFSQHCGFHKL